MNTIEGIIINISTYKNDDMIINVLTENNFESIICRGSKKITNKNNFYLKPLNYGYFMIYKGPTKYFKLSSVNIIQDNSFLYGKLNYLFYFDFIEELTFKMLINNCCDYFLIYKNLLSLLIEFKDNKNPKLNLLKYFYSLLLNNGILNKDQLNKNLINMHENYKVSDILDGSIDFENDLDDDSFKEIINALNYLLKTYLDISLNSIKNII